MRPWWAEAESNHSVQIQFVATAYKDHEKVIQLCSLLFLQHSRYFSYYIFTHLILAEVLILATRWISSCRVILTLTSRSSSSSLQEFNLNVKRKKEYHPITFLEVMLLLESNFGPRPTTHVGKSFDHMELPWKFNNEVYVEMYCEPQCN